MNENQMKEISNYFVENFDVYEFTQEMRHSVDIINNYMPGMDEELNLKHHTAISQDAFNKCANNF
jgi:hypothetical protein